MSLSWTVAICGALILFIIAKMINDYEEDHCPEIIMGYSNCPRWFGRYCDHSDEAVQDARDTMERGDDGYGW